MPFEVFRRHQRKLLAIFAILAMISFVLSDSLTRMLAPSSNTGDPVIVTLKGKPIHRSTLQGMYAQRVLANMFLAEIDPMIGRSFFGGVTDRELVDALILDEEADRLGIPATLEMGRDWLKHATNDRMTADMFEAHLARMNNQVSGAQLLTDIANQVRLMNVRQMLGPPLVTPLDVFRMYRDQNERVSARLVEVPTARFVDKAPEPSSAEVKAFYDKYKDVLPDPARATPGFKIPRQIQLEILSVDGNAIARGLKDKLSDAELRAAYENRKSEFRVRSEFPDEIFAGRPELTPPATRPFDDVRAVLATGLAEERAQSEIVDRFTKVKEEVLIPAADAYADALDEIDLAKKEGRKPRKELVAPPDLKGLADKEKLGYELTPMVARGDLDRLGPVSDAEVGLSRVGSGRKLADEFFDPRKGLYEPAELTDILGMRFLVRKIKDAPPRVPPLEEIRSEVITAWKLERARPLAEKAALAIADQIKKKASTIKETTIDGYRVVATPPTRRKQLNFLGGRFDIGSSTDAPIPDVLYPDETFRDAFFTLKPNEPAVAPNQPRSIYYVLVLDKREPATFSALYAPNGDEYRYKLMSRQEALRKLDDQWMGYLRKEAGLPSDWIPPDEARENASRGV